MSSTAKASALTLYIGPAIASFIAVFEFGKKPDGSLSSTYECTFILPKGYNLEPLKALLRANIESKYGKDPTQWPRDLRNPIRPNSDKASQVDGKLVYMPGYDEGGWFVRASSKTRPGVVDKTNTRITVERADEVYAGMWVMATVNGFMYGGKGTSYTPGVSLGLRNIQKIREGTPLGGRVAPEKEFKPYIDPDDPAGNDATLVTGTPVLTARPKAAADLF